MKFRKSNWKKFTGVTALLTGFIFYSCDNVDYSGKSASSTEVQSTPAITTDNTTTTLSSSDTSSGTSSGRTTRMGRRGKITVAPAPANTKEKMAADNKGFYNYAEVTPSYNGGQGAIESYVTNNLEYPEEAIENGIEGTVNVQFGIDENGNIVNVKTLGTRIGYGLEEAATKAISAMPKWTPGTVKGKKVKTSMILPITFRLEE